MIWRTLPTGKIHLDIILVLNNHGARFPINCLASLPSYNLADVIHTDTYSHQPRHPDTAAARKVSLAADGCTRDDGGRRIVQERFQTKVVTASLDFQTFDESSII